MTHTSLNIVSAGHLEVVRLLLGKEADPTLENETKQSVLWVKDVFDMTLYSYICLDIMLHPRIELR